MRKILLVASAAVVAAQAGAAQAGGGCRMMSTSGAEVVIFADATETADAGDLLGSLKLSPNEASEAVTAPGDFIRYKFRSSRTARWQWVGKTHCSAGEVVKIP